MNKYEPIFHQEKLRQAQLRAMQECARGPNELDRYMAAIAAEGAKLSTPIMQDRPVERDPTGLDPHTPGAKLDAGKVPLRKGALEQFPRALLAVAAVSAHGAQKYTWGGWQTVPDGVQRYLDAGARHAAQRACGEQIDKDSGLSHLAQEAWNILAALELELRSKNI